ncbi:Rad3-related DNA helicase [Modicisalibacter ilicicola DSM 19980]|uniref:Rad3-related DNA helicase n=1 Tax=Modicisalibacter ilicicola DSM 19980 TaxID=1121942 RepID=A0A1M5AVA4_9GAMM|nr:ATP-dependent DNA helicase [Halomonas ilicicola]SHF34135.1 Rad3-related DNA helicase [Halomonas ilicicola DSM 19980]
MNYSIAVRTLCEFTAKAGDLDLRFTPSPSAQQGIAGHGLVASRRDEGYEREIPLGGEYRHLEVRGRADGYDPARNQLEEVKTFRGDLAWMPANHRALHWAQVKIYGHLLCHSRGLSEVCLALVYFDIVSQRETLLRDTFSAQTLEEFFHEQCERFIAWADQEMAHRAARDSALNALGFPHAGFRTGQRPLAEAVYKAVGTGRCLMLQAPTGIGKTLGTLFPMLKALPRQHLDKLFFLAAKTPGRRLALEALATLVPEEADEPAPLRVLELVARDKACEHPDKACHGEACPLASGFYDRLPEARQAAVSHAMLDQAALRDVALAHGICPYYLGQELARWSDVVVGDYNYYFDLNAMLFGLTVANRWRVGVLVDEAHNLVERARRMYSAELDQAAFKAVRRTAPGPLKKPLDRLARQWRALDKSVEAAGVSSDYRVLDSLPTKLLGALHNAVAAITDYLTEQPAGLDAALQTFYFEAMHFCRVAELFDEHSLFDMTFKAGRRGATLSTLCLRNVVPAGFLTPRFEATRATVLFSATLSPSRYYGDLLGLPADTPWLEVESPFSAEQLSVRVVDKVSTRFHHRAASLAPIVELMAEQFAARPGNYLAFFSSFEYLEQVAALFRERCPAVPLWAQSRRMDEPSRQGFLAGFREGGQGIGFAVLGGVFGEGIDLPGERLIGAFIATLGLPQVNPVNEQFRQRLGVLFGDGYDYAYLYPGLQKVVQAAGRVIRTQEDRGVIHLIDDRFARPRVQRLLPNWWKNER